MHWEMCQALSAHGPDRTENPPAKWRVCLLFQVSDRQFVRREIDEVCSAAKSKMTIALPLQVTSREQKSKRWQTKERKLWSLRISIWCQEYCEYWLQGCDSLHPGPLMIKHWEELLLRFQINEIKKRGLLIDVPELSGQGSLEHYLNN